MKCANATLPFEPQEHACKLYKELPRVSAVSSRVPNHPVTDTLHIPFILVITDCLSPLGQFIKGGNFSVWNGARSWRASRVLSKQDMNPQLKQLLRAAALPKSTHLFSQQKPQKQILDHQCTRYAVKWSRGNTDSSMCALNNG